MHQMQVAGKKWDITANDLGDFAKTYDIPDSMGSLRRICHAVAKWSEFAKEAGIAKDELDKIGQFQPEWTKSFR